MYLVVVKRITGLLVWPAWRTPQKKGLLFFASSIFPKTQVPFDKGA